MKFADEHTVNNLVLDVDDHNDNSQKDVRKEDSNENEKEDMNVVEKNEKIISFMCMSGCHGIYPDRMRREK